MSWMRQVDSDLAKEFHIVTYDLRGHGNSDKPLDPAAYRNSTAWGQEAQPIDAAGLKRPVLVGWSYAGPMLSDYLATEAPAKSAASILSMRRSRSISHRRQSGRTCR